MTSSFQIDEGPLREWVLKAYQSEGRLSDEAVELLACVRAFLSGPPGGATVSNRYMFEEDPKSSVTAFISDLEAIRPGLAAQVTSPLLSAVKERQEAGEQTLAPNMTLYISSLAGALALRSEIGETLACALLATTLLGITRLGVDPFLECLGPPPPT